MKHEIDLAGEPMTGTCCECGVDLDELVRDGKLGHACPLTMRRDYIILQHVGSGPNAPKLHLMKAAGHRIVVFAERVEPQPENLPPGLVAIVLPQNCYIDPNWPNEID